ncbi:MAG: oligosaccharide flippase family protein [Emticicia sp.]|uniref:oligosaccharide flippase family protein n=1 Tax=Emticicia sp. TaxID=1930953 RepID=UPI003BA6EC2E
MNDEKKLVAGGSFLFISTLVVNAGNYATNLLLGRWLGPSDFSEASLLVTFMLMVSFFALAFQLTAAKYIVTFEDGKNQYLQGVFIGWLSQKAFIVGSILMALVLMLSVFWQDFFQTSSYLPFIIFGLGLPLYILMSVNRGVLQGLLNYKKLAFSYQYEMWVRLFVSIALVYAGYRVNGVAIGLTMSLLITWWFSRVNLPRSTNNNDIDYKQITQFLITILAYECSQILINNSDIILVKHFYQPFEAGLYAALALIGRIVYFGTWTVVTMLFPIVIKLEKEGKSHTKYFFGGLGLVAIMATFIVGFCYFFPDFLISVLFGKDYLSIAPLLWKYAVATALFACSNVFVYYHLSLDNHQPVWITILAGIAQIVLISMYHQDFEQVIFVQILLMAVLFFTMVCFHFFKKR